MGNIDVNSTKFVESPKVHRPNIRIFYSPHGRSLKLFINGRIERVFLKHSVDPKTCVFIPILGRIITISNVEPGVIIYAVPLHTEEVGYKILTVGENNCDVNASNVPKEAVKGLKYTECAIIYEHIREQYLKRLRFIRMFDSPDKTIAPPKVFVRFRDQKRTTRMKVKPTKEDIAKYRLKLRTRNSNQK